MKPALLRLALTCLSFVLGCHATAVPDAARSVPVPAGAAVRGPAGRTEVLPNRRGAPAGYFASSTGSATGAGTSSDPWTLAVAFGGGYPTGTVQPGDTVWIRGGTYTGQFQCRLNGTAGHPITFRGYPGERAILDGNYDPAKTGNGEPNLYFRNWGSYLIIRDVEFMNSQTGRICAADKSTDRGDCLFVVAPHSKVINNVMHDCGEGLFPNGDADDIEVYGNLIYHNGYWAPVGEQEVAAAIDLIPADEGRPVALSGSFTIGGQSTSPLTFSHNNTGDYVVVIASPALGSSPYTSMSAIYDGAAMTLLNGKNGYGGQPVAIFGIAGHAGTHNIVVTYSDSGGRLIRAMAQSFSNVHQTTPPTAGGTWSNDQWHLPPFGAMTTSAPNHMVVDGIALYNSYCSLQDYNASGDNTRLGDAVTGNNPVVRMSYAAGAANVNMEWNWTPNLYGHGHGMYIQQKTAGTGKLVKDNIFLDQVGYGMQAYGSSGASCLNTRFEGNAFVYSSVMLGGLAGFRLTGSVFTENYLWDSGVNIGYNMADLTDFAVTDNVIHHETKVPSPSQKWNAMTIYGNTIIGTLENLTQANFPTNTFFTPPATPATNLVVIRPNVYETNRANIFVYNWEDLDKVAVDLSSAVASGTLISIMNAQDYYAEPVWSGTYSGGTVSLPMAGLTAAAGIGYTASGPTGRPFNAFIVRAQEHEPWRGPLRPEDLPKFERLSPTRQ